MAGRFGWEPSVSGWNATTVEFGRGEEPAGFMRQVGIDRWEECDAGGNLGFAFTETHRDDWSIYLYDESRGVNLALDLYRRVVVYRDANSTFDLYTILSAVSKPTGWTLRQVDTAPLAGGPRLGSFARTGPRTWVEFSRSGEPGFVFDETHRDDWSVYLHDPSRGVFIQLDVWRKIVGYRDQNTGFDLYSIASARSCGSQAIEPAASGLTANRVDYADAGGATGAFVQTGPRRWTEVDQTGAERYHFVETARDLGAVHLYDVARSATVSLRTLAGTITYRDHAKPIIDLYSITKAHSKVNGRTVNRVVFANGLAEPLGEYRQTATLTWVEVDAEQRPGFRFREIGRDDWSVYLRDPSRGVDLALDLHRRQVVYRDANQSFDLYRIEGASADPVDARVVSPIPAKGTSVRTVWFGGLNGRPQGIYRQVGPTSWQEVGADDQPAFGFQETRRTVDTVELYDESRKVTLVIDLAASTIRYRDPNSEFVLYRVLETSAAMTGHLASEIVVGPSPDNATGVFRATDVDGRAWAEFDSGGSVGFHFEEQRRDDCSILLFDPSRKVWVELDLRLQRVLYGDNPVPGSRINSILSEQIEAARWSNSERITSRSVLSHDYLPNGASLNERPVYRTSITVSPATQVVEIWSSKQVTVEIEGATYTIDAVRPAQIKPNAMSKLSVSVPATDLDCPKLTVRTDLMMPEHRHPVYPDVEAHKKLVGLKPGELAQSRTRLGINSQFSDTDLGHMQRAMQNIAKTKQYTYNRRPAGVHHDRVLHPANMEHPHFVIDLAGDSASYQPLQPHEVPAHIQGAQFLSATVGQGFFADVGHFFKKAAKVVVHTVEAVAGDVAQAGQAVVHDIVQTAENVDHDVVQTVHDVGEDLVHGDLAKAGVDLWQGGEHLGTDLTKGATSVVGDLAGGVASVAGDVAKGAGQLVVMTVHAAEGAVQFVLHHTGLVGQVLQGLFDKIGAAVDKVVGWLLDELGWGDIVQTHAVLVDRFNTKLDEFTTFPAMLRNQSDRFFAQLVDTVSDDIDQAIAWVEPASLAAQPSAGAGHNAAMEKIEWFLGKVLHHGNDAAPLATPFSSGEHEQHTFSLVEDAIGIIEDKLGADGTKLIAAIKAAVGDIGAIFNDPSHGPEYLIAAVLEMVKATAVLALDAVSAVIDLILDALEALLRGLKTMLNATWDIPFIGDLYRTVTHGSELSLLDVVSLILAVPLTIWSKAEFDQAPFAHLGVAASAHNLDPLSADARAWGGLYAYSHLMLAPISAVQDVRSTVEAAIDGVNRIQPLKAESSLDPSTDWILTGFDIVLNAHALYTGAPIPPGEPYALPANETADDVFERPNYFAHVTFWYLVAGFGVNLIAKTAEGVATRRGADASRAAGYFGSIFNTAFGIALIGLMGTIDVADRTKSAVLATLAPGGANATKHGRELFDALVAIATGSAHGLPRPMDVPDGRLTEWEAGIRNYRKWASIPIGGGIPSKGFANVMDGIPAVGQIGTLPPLVEETLGLSVLGTLVFDVIGHMSEGITFAVRTANNELL